jgi:large subunit ribosomal protein L10e
MAKLRPASSYRKLKRPYTRKSRYKEKAFVPGAPNPKITIFHMGDRTREFSYRVSLFSKQGIQVRHNALEAARIASNKVLSETLGKSYHFTIKIYPHNILRQKTMATGAGADRFSTGMAKPFGKPIGSAARVKSGQEIMYVDVDENNVEKAKVALERAGNKLPCKCAIGVKKVSA